ncbi:hypothetical protein DAEQUDRAFT_329264 [Daedalea quercina L-15889]|uniref:Uncharacterized protein n=1 Tax=Daedalea quercina L-15889 TaxID=1314783 RepID=A0A165PQI7_9APHY|nr:hypothetical protein DAEQUDRAFT_329264 [Daedalea quercina L-15889]
MLAPSGRSTQQTLSKCNVVSTDKMHPVLNLALRTVHKAATLMPPHRHDVLYLWTTSSGNFCCVPVSGPQDCMRPPEESPDRAPIGVHISCFIPSVKGLACRPAEGIDAIFVTYSLANTIPAASSMRSANVILREDFQNLGRSHRPIHGGLVDHIFACVLHVATRTPFW